MVPVVRCIRPLSVISRTRLEGVSSQELASQGCVLPSDPMYMSRSASESSFVLVPDCGMQAPPPLHAGENEATGIVVGPVSVVFAGVVQSTWNFQSCRTFVPKLTT